MYQKKEVANASKAPFRGYDWTLLVEKVGKLEDLKDFEGRPLLDAKVVAGLSKILHGDLAKQVQLLEEKAEAKGS